MLIPDKPLFLLIFPFLLATLTSVKGASLRIIGGTEAGEGEFPYLVTVQLKAGESSGNLHQCGGTLVDLSHVITGAHCVFDLFPSDLAVVGGAHLLQDALKGVRQGRNVTNIKSHPYYSYNRNDIALLTVSPPFEEETLVSTLRYPSPHEESSGSCLIAGWGQTAANGDLLSDVLMKGQLTVNPKQDCVNAYGGEYDEATQICAGNMNGERVDNCVGDTGGPLICFNGGGPYFAGISSWGRGCAESGKPGVYTEISKYLGWISYVLSQEQSSTTTTPPPTNPPTENPENDEAGHEDPPAEGDDSNNDDNGKHDEADLSKPEDDKNPPPVAGCGSKLFK